MTKKENQQPKDKNNPLSLVAEIIKSTKSNSKDIARKLPGGAFVSKKTISKNKSQ